MASEEEGRESEVMTVVGLSGCRGGGHRKMNVVGVSECQSHCIEQVNIHTSD